MNDAHEESKPAGLPMHLVVAVVLGCGGVCLLAGLGGVVFAVLRASGEAIPYPDAPPPPPQPAADTGRGEDGDAERAGTGRAQLTLVASHGGQAELEQAASILRQRLAGVGLEGRVQVEGGRLRVDVPEGALEQAVGLLTAGGRLQFKLVAALAEEPTRAEIARIGSLRAARGYDEAAEHYDVAEQRDGSPLLLENPGVEGYLITRVYPAQDAKGQGAIGFEFGPEGRAAFRDLTGHHVNRLLAIVLDGRVETVATILSAVDGEGIVSRDEGGYPPDELEQLVTVLSSGRLPVELSLEELGGEGR